MNFKYKPQKEFYIDYAIKDQMVLDEQTLNLFNVRLKKEVTDLFNRFQIVNVKKPLEWQRSENYEVNEIVHYNGLNYKCIQECINKEPDVEPSFWVETFDKEYTEMYMGRFLAKDNQVLYNPLSLEPYESSYDYHPTTVKHVEDRLRYWFDNETVTNADRLDGEHKEYFCSREEFLEHLKTALTEKDVIDRLDSDSRVKPLSAKQGKILKEFVDRINTILTSNDVNLDELQEIVNWIKTNRELINTLGIDSIHGLREYLNRVDQDINNRVTLEKWENDFINKLKEVDGTGSGVDADLLDGRDSTYFLPASSFTPQEICNLLAQVPGNLGKIDADKLDGLDSTDFLKRSSTDTPTQDNAFNLGSNAKRWANIFAVNFQGTALKAKYADLAEIYEVSEELKKVLEPGDVLGIDESGVKLYSPNDKLFGVVSDKPGFLLNSWEDGVAIALKGRTPVKIFGVANVSDYIYAYKDGVGIASKTKMDNHELIGICIRGGKGICEVKI